MPTIDIGALARHGAGTADRDARRAVGERIGRACVETGCFLVVNHGIDPRLTASLHDAATRFFALPDPAAPTAGPAAREEPTWGVGEHTDYGLHTLLAQDAGGGPEVRVGGQWVPVRFRPGSLICNVGDMMEVATGGRVRSTPHRVPVSERDRVSFALFLDPAWDAVVVPLTGDATRTARDPAHGPTYGEYLTAKVAPVFPELFAQVADSQGRAPGP